MGANFDDGWTSDNKTNPTKTKSKDIKSPQKHQLYFAKEKRRGKVVTIVKPFYLNESDLKFLLKTLKKRLGTGGTIRDDSLEFQGEIEEKLSLELEKLDFRLKK